MRIQYSGLSLLAVGLLACTGQAQAQSANWGLSVFTGGNVGRTSEAFSGSAAGSLYSRGSVYASNLTASAGIRTGSEVVFSGVLSGGINAGYNVTLNGGTVSGGVVSGGSLKSTSGTTNVSGGATLAGTNQAGSHVNVSGGVTTGAAYVQPNNFAAMDSAFRAVSNQADALANTGFALVSGHTLTFNATSAGTNVFDVTAAQIANAQSFVINGSSAATFVINVTGSSVAFAANSWSFAGGASAAKTMFNAAGAFDVTATGTLSATLLAPDALVRLTNTSVHGSVVALGLQGSGCFDGGFTGTVPAPGALAMVCFGGLVAIRRRR